MLRICICIRAIFHYRSRVLVVRLRSALYFIISSLRHVSLANLLVESDLCGARTRFGNYKTQHLTALQVMHDLYNFSDAYQPSRGRRLIAPNSLVFISGSAAPSVFRRSFISSRLLTPFIGQVLWTIGRFWVATSFLIDFSST